MSTSRGKRPHQFSDPASQRVSCSSKILISFLGLSDIYDIVLFVM
jgi:hypothetical protein